MQKIITKSVASTEDMEKIQSYARRELCPDEIYVFNVVLCNNDIDRDFERFSVNALYQLAPMFVGKTGIFDHSMKSSDQRMRVFDTWVEKVDGKKTKDNQDFYQLCAKVYMLNNEQNKALIDDIDFGIKKEVSVSCSVKNAYCSICSTDKRSGFCEHKIGKSYGDKLCYSTLDCPTDAYEFSFVAVPAQREAGVTKGYRKKEVEGMDEIITKMSDCTGDVVLSKSQAKEISSYIDNLKQDALIGEEYKKQLSKEVIGIFKKAFPNMDEKLFVSITSVMTTKELLGFKGEADAKMLSLKKPQLATNITQKTNNFSQFKI